jgi:hypothetical protein
MCNARYKIFATWLPSFQLLATLSHKVVGVSNQVLMMHSPGQAARREVVTLVRCMSLSSLLRRGSTTKRTFVKLLCC